MGSVRLRVVSGQAAAVPGVHVPPCEFLVVAVATLGALTSQPATANAWQNGLICAIASSEVPSSGCYWSWQCAQPSSSGFGVADFLPPIERGSALLVASFPRAVGGEML